MYTSHSRAVLGHRPESRNARSPRVQSVVHADCYRLRVVTAWACARSDGEPPDRRPARLRLLGPGAGPRRPRRVLGFVPRGGGRDEAEGLTGAGAQGEGQHPGLRGSDHDASVNDSERRGRLCGRVGVVCVCACMLGVSAQTLEACVCVPERAETEFGMFLCLECVCEFPDFHENKPVGSACGDIDHVDIV